MPRQESILCGQLCLLLAYVHRCFESEWRLLRLVELDEAGLRLIGKLSASREKTWSESFVYWVCGDRKGVRMYLLKIENLTLA